MHRFTKTEPLQAATFVFPMHARNTFHKFEAFSVLMDASIAAAISDGTESKHKTTESEPKSSAQHALVLFTLKSSGKIAKDCTAMTREHPAPVFLHCAHNRRPTTVPQNRRMNRMSTLMCALSGQSLSEPEHWQLSQHRENTGRRTLLTTSLILTAIKKNSCRKRQLELLC